MRAFLFILLLTLLPLQFSAASTMACCDDESDLQGPQTGHQPSPRVQLAGTVADMVTIKSCFDLDCGVCLAHCVGAVESLRVMSADPAGAVLAEHSTQIIRHHSREQPYRPRWPAPHGSGFRAHA